jgi:MOSC domain-containing protein YiiM
MRMAKQGGRIVAVSVSSEKGVPKTNVEGGLLVAEHGLRGDAHAGPWHRQVSFLAVESIAKMRDKGADVHPGSFAENITTEGIDFGQVAVGDQVVIGDALLEITQLGKECHARCAIFHLVGDCVMPKEGVFAKVLRGGMVQAGDMLQVVEGARPAGGADQQ